MLTSVRTASKASAVFVFYPPRALEDGGAHCDWRQATGLRNFRRNVTAATGTKRVSPFLRFSPVFQCRRLLQSERNAFQAFGSRVARRGHGQMLADADEETRCP